MIKFYFKRLKKKMKAKKCKYEKSNAKLNKFLFVAELISG